MIGITLCPGKQASSSHTGAPWARDLAADMAVIARWRPGAMLSLIGRTEAQELGVSALPWHVPAGVRHWWEPIVDTRVPDTGWLQRWHGVAADLCVRLRDGERVLLHCRGGLGRAGTVAAMLLIEFGLAPARAIERVRSARPGAIENREQEAFVHAYRPAHRARGERFEGCLIAGAIGDALGAPIEFDSREQILRRHGPLGLRRLMPAYGLRGAITDDTQMALFTAEGLLRSRASQAEPPGLRALAAIDLDAATEQVGVAYQHWLATQGESSPAMPDAMRIGSELLSHRRMHARRAPGNTCLSALCGKRHAGEAAHNRSKGCGAVMRVAPVGLFIAGLCGSLEAAGPRARQAAIDIAWRLGERTARLTHGHPVAARTAGYLAALVLLLVDGAAPRHAIEMLATRLHGDASLRDVAAWVEAACREERMAAARCGAAADAAGLAAIHAEHLARLGEGWTADEAFAMALYCLLAADTIADGLAMAVNISGDSDSVGAIAGHLLGAHHGSLGPSTLEGDEGGIAGIEMRATITSFARRLMCPGLDR